MSPILFQRQRNIDTNCNVFSRKYISFVVRYSWVLFQEVQWGGSSACILQLLCDGGPPILW